MTTDNAIENRFKERFWWIFGLTLGLKLWLAAGFPFTGDEAFFYQWGVYPDWGYYDHPPMVGWLLWLLRHISDHPLALRLATVMLWSLIALGVVDLLKRMLPQTDAPRAYGLGILFLLLPFTWALNAVTTDTPLIFFMFCSGYCFLRMQDAGKWLSWAMFCGVFLGLALLSKFFAGLLAIAYFVACCRSLKGWKQLVLIALCALPFFAINMAYNATHCWNNVMFNLVNRHEGANTSVKTIFVYLGMMLYLITPWVLWQFKSVWSENRAKWALYSLFLVPFALFLLLSVKKTIGLHWVLGFLPFVFVAYGLFASTEGLNKQSKWTALLGIPHLLLLAAFIVPSTDFWAGRSLHEKVVFHRETPEIVRQLRLNLPADGKIAAFTYTPAALLSYHAKEYVPVLGPGKYHARQDDVIVDFRLLDGKPIRVFDNQPIDPAKIKDYFESVSLGEFEVNGVKFYYADGKAFRYLAFRDTALKTVFEKYYQIPAFLPRYGCQFTERYGF
jgi:hypothetical protein